MLPWMAAIALALTTADHWTTYLCLRAPVAGFEVLEANPFADQLFAALGLVPGLMVDSAITLVAIVFLITTSQLSSLTKEIFLGLVCMATAYAVVNNLQAMSELGLSPLGWS